MKHFETSLTSTTHYLVALLCGAIAFGVSCSGGDDDDKKRATPGAPEQGSERGACYPNMTCDTGLMCASDLCVKVVPPAQDMSERRDAGEDMARVELDMPADMHEEDADGAADLGDLSDGGNADAGPEDMGEQRERVEEVEPNDGAMLDEINALPLDALGSGIIATPGDADVWRIDVPPGQVYTVTLSASANSTYQEHLTVIDSGRRGKAAGEDYVKIAQRTTSSGASLTFVTMGEGGYFLAVRDARDVGLSSPSQGSAAHTYTLRVNSRTLAEVTASRDPFAQGGASGALSQAGAIDVYPFTVLPGAGGADRVDLVADLRAESQTMDARMIVYSVMEESWIARQDNRSQVDINPLIDAPLFGVGEMWLIVENITPESTMLGYTLTATLQ